MAIKIALVLPAYNEGKHIERSLGNIKRGIGEVREKYPGLEGFVLHIVDDASTDDSVGQVMRWSEAYGLETVLYQSSEDGKKLEIQEREKKDF